MLIGLACRDNIKRVQHNSGKAIRVCLIILIETLAIRDAVLVSLWKNVSSTENDSLLRAITGAIKTQS